MGRRGATLWILLSLLLMGCGEAEPKEADLRLKFGIPEGAERVLFLSQSTHADINWRSTFEEYYQDDVREIFDEAVAWLEAEPGAQYSIAEMAFLERYLEDSDASRLKAHATSGRLRIVGGGLTSPDTVLPTAETLIRDYLMGSLVAERTLGVQARSAWLPESFGHSPSIPDVLGAMGFTSVGFARADGARHPYEILANELEPIAPNVDSTASMLLELGSADFVWKGPGGGEILAHYMPIDLYCQGDRIDLDGIAIGGGRLGTEQGDNPRYTDERLFEFARELAPYAKTPYLFVPVGCDFQRPRPKLTEYASGFNERYSASTGLYVVVATFEDYMDLIAFHKDKLPELAADITPYWTGFYGTRPGLKRLARLSSESLIGAEAFSLLASEGVRNELAAELKEAWRFIALSNHHDYITGTANDRVTYEEQEPWLVQSLATANRAWQRVLADLGTQFADRTEPEAAMHAVFNSAPVLRAGVVEVQVDSSTEYVVRHGDQQVSSQLTANGTLAFVAQDVPAYGWRTFSVEPGARLSAPSASAHVDETSAELVSDRVRIAFSRDADGGWSLQSLRIDDEDILGSGSLEWNVFGDSGGLYRIGSEMNECPGSRFSIDERVRPRDLSVLESGPARAALRLSTTGPQPLDLDISLGAGDDRVLFTATGSAAAETTVVLSIRPEGAEPMLQIGIPGGSTSRPLAHLYEPSFWPAVGWFARGRAAVHLGQSTGVMGSVDGTLFWMVFRNAQTEVPCDNVGPKGTDDVARKVEFALATFTSPAHEAARSMALNRALRVVRASGEDRLSSEGRLFSQEGDGVFVAAAKRADRGDGIILHLQRPAQGSTPISIGRGALDWAEASSCDVMERNDVPVSLVRDGVIELSVKSALSAVRLR